MNKTGATQGKTKSSKTAKSSKAPAIAGARSKPSASEAKPESILSGGDPEFAKADGDAPAQTYIAAMPGSRRDVAVPVSWTPDPATTLEFYRALGFNVIDDQVKPYVSLDFERDGLNLHFTTAPKALEFPFERVDGLVIVDNIAEKHEAFAGALKRHYGRVPARGCPRITRFRPGQSRFTLVDPHGNTFIFIQSDERRHLDYGGDPSLSGLARVLDNARILRDFRNDDHAARRMLEVGLRRFEETATFQDRAQAYQALMELAEADGDTETSGRWREKLESAGRPDAQ